ncbi:apoptosis-associated speck-like protein containing a CARD [Mantella aurantiaca]
MADSRHFVDRHREDLISRVSLVDPILDGLLQEDLLTDEQYDRVRCQSTSQDKMRELYSHIRGWADDHKDKFYEILQKHNRPLIKDLQSRLRDLK